MTKTTPTRYSIRCDECGAFIDRATASKSMKYFGVIKHLPNCFVYKMTNEDSLKGKVLRVLTDKGNFTIEYELVIDLSTLSKNIEKIIKMIKENE